MLRDNGFPDLAKEFYLKLINEAKSYREQHNVSRHIGMLYANLAIAYIYLNDTDQALYQFHNAANEDAVAGVAYDDSYAKKLLEHTIIKRIKDRLLITISSIDSTITINNIDVRWEQLEYGRAFALIAYLNSFYQNLSFYKKLGNVGFEYTYWQIFSTIRNLSAFVEVELKTKAQRAIANADVRSLYYIAKSLYNQQPWWTQFESERARIGATANSPQASEVVISDALSMVHGSNLFWKNLVVVYAVRNHTIHDMKIAGAFTPTQLEAILASIVYVLLKA
jgi:hypothetical protein